MGVGVGGTSTSYRVAMSTFSSRGEAVQDRGGGGANSTRKTAVRRSGRAEMAFANSCGAYVRGAPKKG